jgi:anthranilate phosphoribosyltransferase
MKGESIDEITAAARVMRDLAIKIDVSDIQLLVDIVGTGGDGQNLFNVSTASSFVIAAAGATIAKHGNRGVSSKSGSSDLLNKQALSLILICNKPNVVSVKWALVFYLHQIIIKP